MLLMNKLFAAFGKLLYLIVLPVFRHQIRYTYRTYVIILYDQEALLLKGWLGRQLWGLPGGGRHKGEDNKAAAIRETYEETKIKLNENDLIPLCSGIFDTDKLGFNYEFFVCKLDAKPNVKIRKGEIIESAWLDIKDVPSKDISSEIRLAFDLIISNNL
jgi:8-oxo-dGTP pyrophosphatase MutT (NUDIX family)